MNTTILAAVGSFALGAGLVGMAALWLLDLARRAHALETNRRLDAETRLASITGPSGGGAL